MALPPWDVTTMAIEPEVDDEDQENISTTPDAATTESEADLFFKDQELIATHEAVIMESRAETAAHISHLEGLEKEGIDLDAVMNGYAGIRLLTSDGSQLDIKEDLARRATYLNARLDANSNDRVMAINTPELVVKKLAHWYQHHRYWSFNTYYEGRQAYVREPQITKEWMDNFFNVNCDVLWQINIASRVFNLEDLRDATIEQIAIRHPRVKGICNSNNLVITEGTTNVSRSNWRDTCRERRIQFPNRVKNAAAGEVLSMDCGFWSY